MWRGCEGGFIEDDRSNTPWPLSEKERLKRNLSEGEKVLEFPLKLLRELFFSPNKSRAEMYYCKQESTLIMYCM